MNIIKAGDFLLPKDIDLSKWSVVACDQYTAEPDYWSSLNNFIGDAPSTLRMILPEIYLSDNKNFRIQKINDTMRNYLACGLFKEIKDCFILVVRDIGGGKNRVGLQLTVDLEQYEWKRVDAKIRATEDTLPERLIVRSEIRKDACLELSHILMLIDDKEKTVIEPLYENKEKYEKLYDFDLNMGGGHLTGYKIPASEKLIKKITDFLDPKLQIEKYGRDAGLLFAVGDGNHSLATAKKCWDELKSKLTEKEKENHPARFAMAEVVNIYDEAMDFHPIHRVVFGRTEGFIEGLKATLFGQGKLHTFDLENEYNIECPTSTAEVIAGVQKCIEKFSKTNEGFKVDYIHDIKHLEKVVEATKGIGIVMPAFSKEELFNYVLNVGNLPKKAFSIGTAELKKYYLEARKI